MNGSDWIRIQRAKALILGTSTPQNRTGDYLAERRFGKAPILFQGAIAKPCCTLNFPLAVEITYYTDPYLDLTWFEGAGNAAYSWDNGPLVEFDPTSAFHFTGTGSGRNLKVYSDSGFISINSYLSNASSIIFSKFFNAETIGIGEPQFGPIPGTPGTDIITTLDLAGFSQLNNVTCVNNNISQAAADSIVAELVANGVQNGVLFITSQAGGTLDSSGWGALVANGWTIF